MTEVENEMQAMIKSYGANEYNKGRLQGIWEFYRALEETHETPKEIFERLRESV